ncbi:MAG TPA: hypothetical protein VFG05_04130 [Methylocella sp.]|nr:hypothetical protein [Methylocella sp.]
MLQSSPPVIDIRGGVTLPSYRAFGLIYLNPVTQRLLIASSAASRCWLDQTGSTEMTRKG